MALAYLQGRPEEGDALLQKRAEANPFSGRRRLVKRIQDGREDVVPAPNTDRGSARQSLADAPPSIEQMQRSIHALATKEHRGLVGRVIVPGVDREKQKLHSSAVQRMDEVAAHVLEDRQVTAEELIGATEVFQESQAALKSVGFTNHDTALKLSTIAAGAAGAGVGSLITAPVAAIALGAGAGAIAKPAVLAVGEGANVETDKLLAQAGKGALIGGVAAASAIGVKLAHAELSNGGSTAATVARGVVMHGVKSKGR